MLFTFRTASVTLGLRVFRSAGLPCGLRIFFFDFVICPVHMVGKRVERVRQMNILQRNRVRDFNIHRREIPDSADSLEAKSVRHILRSFTRRSDVTDIDVLLLDKIHKVLVILYDNIVKRNSDQSRVDFENPLYEES